MDVACGGGRFSVGGWVDRGLGMAPRSRVGSVPADETGDVSCTRDARAALLARRLPARARLMRGAAEGFVPPARTSMARR